MAKAKPSNNGADTRPTTPPPNSAFLPLANASSQTASAFANGSIDFTGPQGGATRKRDSEGGRISSNAGWDGPMPDGTPLDVSAWGDLLDDMAEFAPLNTASARGEYEGVQAAVAAMREKIASASERKRQKVKTLLEQIAELDVQRAEAERDSRAIATRLQHKVDAAYDEAITAARAVGAFELTEEAILGIGPRPEPVSDAEAAISAQVPLADTYNPIDETFIYRVLSGGLTGAVGLVTALSIYQISGWFQEDNRLAQSFGRLLQSIFAFLHSIVHADVPILSFPSVGSTTWTLLGHIPLMLLAVVAGCGAAYGSGYGIKVLWYECALKRYLIAHPWQWIPFFFQLLVPASAHGFLLYVDAVLNKEGFIAFLKANLTSGMTRRTLSPQEEATYLALASIIMFGYLALRGAIGWAHGRRTSSITRIAQERARLYIDRQEAWNEKAAAIRAKEEVRNALGSYAALRILQGQIEAPLRRIGEMDAQHDALQNKYDELTTYPSAYLPGDQEIVQDAIDDARRHYRHWHDNILRLIASHERRIGVAYTTQDREDNTNWRYYWPYMGLVLMKWASRGGIAGTVARKILDNNNDYANQKTKPP